MRRERRGALHIKGVALETLWVAFFERALAGA
jgi:hypothetical protein